MHLCARSQEEAVLFIFNAAFDFMLQGAVHERYVGTDPFMLRCLVLAVGSQWLLGGLGRRCWSFPIRSYALDSAVRGPLALLDL